MADNIEITLKPIEVKPDSAPAINYDNLSADQKLIANKIFDEAERQGVDPDLMLSIAHIENRFNTGASPKGALGPMQLMPGTAKDLNVDPNDIDQNISGGVTYYKTMLDKYKDPYVAGIAYNAGPGVADKFLETDDLNDIPSETKNYIDQLDRLYKPKSTDIDTGDLPEVTTMPPAEENNDLRNKAIAGATTATIAGLANTDTRQKMIEAEAEQSTPKERARAKLRSENADIALKEKSKTATGRLTNQQSLVQDAEKRMASWDKAFTKAQDRLAAAEELARKLGIVEESVQTSPGGVTQKGGLGSGAMKHSNTMGEVHEANVVRKGTEATGSGWQQKSRLIVPEKYAATSSLSTEQLLARKNLDNAQRDYRQAQKDLSVAKSAHAKESGKLANLSKQTEQGLSRAEENLNIAKEQYKNVASKKAPGMIARAGQQVGKSLFGSVIPGAAAGVDLEDARQRYNRGDIPGAVISGIGGVGGAMSMIPPIPPIGTAARLIGGLTSLVAPAINYYRDATATEDEQAAATAKQAADAKPGFSIGGSVAAILAKKAAEAAAKKTAESAAKKSATVMRPKRVAYPGIYDDPKKLVAEATSRVEEESPLLKRLFGVTRDDLFNITEQGRRKGNITERPFKAAPNATGAGHAQEVMNPRNVQRIQDIIGESKNSPELYKGMASWYTMDPLFNRYVELYGLENAIKEYNRFNTFTGMASPGSEVLTELNRGSAANWLDAENRFSDFIKYGRKAGTGPEDMQNVLGHKYHITSHGLPMSKYIESGIVDMGSAKVPSYIAASGVPETGFQTSWPVGDAHWSRLVGLPDVRGPRTLKGVEVLPNASASVPEMVSLGPWWEEKIAKPMELESVPAQAVVWGSGSGATGVTSPIGAPKLELISKLIGDTANRLGVSPETARDLVILRKTHLAEGGLVQGYDDGGKVDLANSSKYIDGSSRENNPYGYVLDDSNSRMDVSPRASLDRANISDRGNLVHNMVSERDRSTDKYLGSTGRLASKGLEYLRTALDKAPSFTGKTLSSMGIDPNYVPIVGPMVAASRPTRQSDVVNGELKIGTDLLFGQLPETLYDYTTSGQPGFVRGGKWVPSPATGGMTYENVYGDVNAFDFLNLAGMQVPFVKAGKAAYKAASPLLRKVMNPPVAVMESTSPGLLQNTYRMRNTGELANDPAGLALTDERAQEALGTSGLDKYNVTTGQGAWGGDSGSEFNRAYAVTLPRLGPLSKYDSQLAQFGSDTDQMMMSSIRFTPQKGSSASTAIKVNNVSEQDIINLNKKLGDNFVVQHRPKDKSAVIYNWTNKPKQMGALEDTIYSVVPNKKLTFGTYESSVIGDEGKYSKFNVKPKTPKLIDIEKRAAQRENKRKK